MKKMQLNMENLTALWTLGGKAAGNYINNGEYLMSVVPNSEWPNKLWFHTKPKGFLMEKILKKEISSKVTIPVWGTESHNTEAMLNAFGFNFKNELTGMSIRLNSVKTQQSRLQIDHVHDRITASIWSEVFQGAFGYLIHPDTVVKTMNKIHYYIARMDTKPVGTAMLFIDRPSVAGIHSMGILPNQRRRGYAQEFLIYLLNAAKDKGALHAMLQASAMGKGLYLRNGFKEDFQIKNFINH